MSADEGATLQFAVTLDDATPAAFEVGVRLVDISATGGPAPLSAPADYDNAVVRLNFAGDSGETQHFSVDTRDDLDVEGTESFRVILDANDVAVTDTDTAIGTITDVESFLVEVARLKGRIIQKETDGYTAPDEAEQTDFHALAETLLHGNFVLAQARALDLNYELVEFTDSDTGQQFWELRETAQPLRGWGSYFFNVSSSRNALVEVPHPLADLNTWDIGANTFIESDALGFLMAGAHRRANDDPGVIQNTADVAHLTDSIFHIVHQAWNGASNENTAWQIHGFNIDNHGFPAATDAVLSDGDGATVTAEILRLDGRLQSQAGLLSYNYNNLAPTDPLNVEVNDGVSGTTFSSLAATNNVQGQHSRSAGSFVHIELERDVRDNDAAAASAATAIANAIQGLDDDTSPTVTLDVNHNTIAEQGLVGLVDILIPAYANPCCGDGPRMWSSLIEAAASGFNVHAILNPASGPGASPIDPNYVNDTGGGPTGPVLDFNNAGGVMYGYVATGYAGRDIADVKSDVDTYYDPAYWRGAGVQINGIFFDEMSNDLADVGYYNELRDHVRAKSGAAKVIGNPGTTFTEDSSNGSSGFTVNDYALTADTLMTFENTADEYHNNYTAPSWLNDFSADHFAHVVHSEADPSDMLFDVDLARLRKAGLLYVSDDVLPDPYDTLASYWTNVATFAATLSEPSALPVTVDLGFGGTASLADDYTRSSARIVILPGETTGSVTIEATLDTLMEGDETVVVEITGVTGGMEAGAQQQIVTISNGDATNVAPLDANRDGAVDASTDGNQILTVLFGLPASNIERFRGNTTLTNEEIEQGIQQMAANGTLDVNADGVVDASTDGNLILTVLFELPTSDLEAFRGSTTLTNAEIEQNILNLANPPGSSEPAASRAVPAAGSEQGQSEEWFVLLADDAVSVNQSITSSQPAIERYEPFLLAVQSRLGREIEVTHAYVAALNGLVVQLTAAEADVVRGLDWVVDVRRPSVFTSQTDVGPQWIGADALWQGTATGGLPGTMGEGVIVGVIDGGIDFDNVSFADVGPVDGYDHTNPLGAGNYLGLCDPNSANHDPTVTCNDKLIGIYDFTPSTGINDPQFSKHGSHVSSIAAGNFVQAPIPGLSETATLSGVAPHANIIVYDVCRSDVLCYESEVVAAVDQAILDGVNVINFSIGGFPTDILSPAPVAFRRARNAGIFVAVSGGNDGPAASTVDVPASAPWLTAVANSSHNRLVSATLDVTSPQPVPTDLQGLAYTPGEGVVINSDIEPTTVRDAAAVDPANHEGCSPFAANAFSGVIALIDRGTCFFADKVQNAEAAGALAVIVANNRPGQRVTMIGVDVAGIPSVFVTQDDGTALRDWIAANSDAMVRINSDAVRVVDDSAGDIVSSSSSRGPNPYFDVFTPPVAAPGTEVLAAFSSTGDDEWGFLSGTSMSSPHVAGAAALLTALHPDWTPAEMQSALMLTSVPYDQLVKEDGATPADPFDMGAGRVDLTNASLAGFVLDESNSNFENLNTRATSRLLNLPGFVHSGLTASYSWTRTLRSTQDVAVEWTPSFTAPANTVIEVDPPVVSLAAGATESITVRVDFVDVPADPAAWNFGQLVLTPDTAGVPEAHFPLAAKWADDAVGIVIAERSIREGDAPIMAKVFRTSDTTNALTVDLLSDQSGQAAVVASVTIDAGQSSSAPFFVTAVDDQIDDGTHTVTVTASAAGHTSGTDTVEVSDNDAIVYAWLDTNQNGEVDASTDGNQILTVLFGLPAGNLDRFRGNSMLSNEEIEQSIQQMAADGTLDVNEDGAVDASTDGNLILSVLFGLPTSNLEQFRGNASLTNEEIEQNVQSLANPAGTNNFATRESGNTGPGVLQEWPEAGLTEVLGADLLSDVFATISLDEFSAATADEVFAELGFS